MKTWINKREEVKRIESIRSERLRKDPRKEEYFWVLECNIAEWDEVSDIGQCGMEQMKQPLVDSRRECMAL